MDTEPLFTTRTDTHNQGTRVCLAALLALGAFGTVQADGGDEETLGVARAVVLPSQAAGNPPSWAGRAFQQGVVAVANPYGAEAGARIHAIRSFAQSAEHLVAGKCLQQRLGLRVSAVLPLRCVQRLQRVQLRPPRLPAPLAPCGQRR